MQKYHYCLCLSGKLGYIILQDLYKKGITIACVLTDSNSASIIEYCESQLIKLFKGNPRRSKASNWLKENEITFDYILSVNYLFIIEEDLLNYARVAVNFHGSLLPKYRGRTPHVWAIINGEKECGITAHLMNAKCDDGDIVKQIPIPIQDDDTGATVLNKYNEMYPVLVNEIVTMLETNTLISQKQDSNKATYYGKRTPEDGGINWDWQKDRIRNWVRAQARPYPGAFSHIDEKKIVIHRVSYSDFGYIDTTPNGYILGMSDDKPIVKTQNGAIVIEDFEFSEAIKEGQILKTLYNE